MGSIGIRFIPQINYFDDFQGFQDLVFENRSFERWHVPLDREWVLNIQLAVNFSTVIVNFQIFVHAKAEYMLFI
jgi:hypothetical protein